MNDGPKGMPPELLEMVNRQDAERRARPKPSAVQLAKGRTPPRVTGPTAPSEDPDDGTTNDLDTWWLPAPVRDWCEAVAKAYAVPRVMPISAALCAAASVLQGRVRVRIKPGWEEPLCLFWLVFVRTGGKKSAVMERATAALHRWQAELNEEVKRDAKLADFERKRLDAQLRRLRAQKRGTKGPTGVTGDAHAEWLSEVKELESQLAEVKRPVEHDLLQSDVNPSLLPKVLRNNYDAEGIARLAILDDEGTALANLMGRHQGQPILESALKAYGGHWAKMTRASKVGDGYVRVELPHSYMTICVFAQPHYHNLLSDAAVLSTSGFVGRCIVDMVDAGDPGWDAEPVPEHVQQAYDSWLLRLAQEDVPELVDLWGDRDARAALKRCYEARERDGSGTAQRIVGRVARIVALCAVGEGDSAEGSIVADVGGVDTRGGVAYMRKVDHLFSLIYSQRLRQVTAIDRPVDALTTLSHRVLLEVRHLQQLGPKVYVRELQQHMHVDGRRVPSEALYETLDELANAGYLDWDQETRSRYRGKERCRAVRVHPRPPPELEAVPDPAEDWGRGEQ